MDVENVFQNSFFFLSLFFGPTCVFAVKVEHPFVRASFFLNFAASSKQELED